MSEGELTQEAGQQVGEVKEQLVRPLELPVVDSFGYEMLSFQCWRCKREGWVSVSVLEIHKRRGTAIFCLPCQEPERWKWKKEKLPDGTVRETLHPETSKRPQQKLPGMEDKLELEHLTDERAYLLARRVEIAEKIERLQQESKELEAKLVELDQRIPNLEKRVDSTFNNPYYDKLAFAQKLQTKIAELEAQMKKEGLHG